MSSSENKKRKKTKKPSSVLLPTLGSTQILSLPHDLVVSCIACVSILYYPTLSTVSKTYRSLIASSELYQARSSLNRTESCLYVYLKFHDDPTPRWYSLCQKPNPNITNDTSTRKRKKKPCGYVLASIKSPHSPPVYWSDLVSVGSNIYIIGGLRDKASSRVSIFDCRSQTWQDGPSMKVERRNPAVNVIDGKIYVAGGCEGCDKSKWMEVFDPVTECWETVSCPGAEIRGCAINISAGIDGKVYVFGNANGLAYDTKEGRWEIVGWGMDIGWEWFSYSVIGNVIYCYRDNEFKWYDSKLRMWKKLLGVKGLPKFPLDVTKLADYGGKMAVLWYRRVASSEVKNKTIWCAVIELERGNNDEEIWGKVEWYDAVLTVPESCRMEYAISATL